MSRLGARLALHLVTDDRLPFDRLLEVVDAVAGAGVDVVQLRARSVTARELIRQAHALSDVIDRRCLLLVNDRVDVAVAARDAGARVDGVHLGRGDLPPETARRLLGTHAVVGWSLSCGQRRDAASVPRFGTIDYVGVGAIRSTSTTPDNPSALGVDGFGAFAARSDLPCVAMGGVDQPDVAALRDAGAAGIAVVSAICGAADPAAAARALRSAADAPGAAERGATGAGDARVNFGAEGVGPPRP